MRALNVGFPHVYTEKPWRREWRTWAGATDYATGYIYLHPLVARDLERLRLGWNPQGRVQTTMASSSIHTLAHELVHRSGQHNERTADRVGMVRFLTVARKVGVSPARALRLRRALGGVYR